MDKGPTGGCGGQEGITRQCCSRLLCPGFPNRHRDAAEERENYLPYLNCLFGEETPTGPAHTRVSACQERPPGLPLPEGDQSLLKRKVSTWESRFHIAGAPSLQPREADGLLCNYRRGSSLTPPSKPLQMDMNATSGLGDTNPASALAS